MFQTCQLCFAFHSSDTSNSHHSSDDDDDDGPLPNGHVDWLEPDENITDDDYSGHDEDPSGHDGDDVTGDAGEGENAGNGGDSCMEVDLDESAGEILNATFESTSAL